MIVVADTSVILNLALVGCDTLLEAMFGVVIIPPAVESEFQRLAASSGRFAGLTVPSWLRVQAPTAIAPRIAADAALDLGEAQALALALEIHADAVLIDEAHARLVATELGLTPIGILGILLRSKRDGRIAEIRGVLATLRERAGFRIADDLYREVLRLAGELTE